MTIEELKIQYDNYKMLHKQEPKKVFAVITFKNEQQLNISQDPAKWVTVDINYFLDGLKTLTYACVQHKNDVTQIAEGMSLQELYNDIKEIQQGMNDPVWANEYLYPYLN